MGHNSSAYAGSPFCLYMWNDCTNSFPIHAYGNDYSSPITCTYSYQVYVEGLLIPHYLYVLVPGICGMTIHSPFIRTSTYDANTGNDCSLPIAYNMMWGMTTVYRRRRQTKITHSPGTNFRGDFLQNNGGVIAHNGGVIAHTMKKRWRFGHIRSI